jgi:hypothetical protein
VAPLPKRADRFPQDRGDLSRGEKVLVRHPRLHFFSRSSSGPLVEWRNRP